MAGKTGTWADARHSLVRTFFTGLKPPASPAAGAAVGRACGLRPVPPSAAPGPEGGRRADLDNTSDHSHRAMPVAECRATGSLIDPQTVKEVSALPDCWRFLARSPRRPNSRRIRSNR